MSASDARVVRTAGRRHRKRVLVLDWVAYGAGHSSWFAGDGIHLAPAGARGFARVLRRGLRASAPLRARILPPAPDPVMGL